MAGRRKKNMTIEEELAYLEADISQKEQDDPCHIYDLFFPFHSSTTNLCLISLYASCGTAIPFF